MVSLRKSLATAAFAVASATSACSLAPLVRVGLSVPVLGHRGTRKATPTISTPTRGVFPVSERRLTSIRAATGKAEVEVEVKSYEHDGYKLTFRHKPASPSREGDPPLVLIHPVGIGLSSWFWSKFLKAWDGGDAYAPDLLGCGLESGADAWDPDERGMSVPLGWVRAVEALIQAEVLAPRGSTGTMGAIFSSSRPPRSCVVVAQGGLAPVGVLLAHRNPPPAVSHLVLTSPPTWEDMTAAVPELELEKNYGFFRSRLGALAFDVLESRWAVRLFSDLFLFRDKCDEKWVDSATGETATVEARPPVMVFNSGFLNHRSYEEMLRTMEQPTLILSGTDDTSRQERRKQYETEMRRCVLKSLPGKNVLPWESPTVVRDAINEFVKPSRL